MMCSDIDCVTRNIHELNGTVEPDLKGDMWLQKKNNIVIASESDKTMELRLHVWGKWSMVPILNTRNRMCGPEESTNYKQNTKRL